MSKSNTKIFIGMDVSEKSIEICGLPAESDNGKTTRIDNDPGSVNSFLDKFPALKNVTVAMETGTHSPWLAELIQARGCKTLVGHARKLRAIWSDDKKCDKRDAEMLARIAKFDAKLLHPIKPRSKDSRIDLAVLKARDALVKTSTIMINHLHGALRSFGVKTGDLDPGSFHNTVKDLIPRELAAALRGLLRQLAHVRKEIKSYDKKLETLCRKYSECRKLRQVKGVGPISAMAFILTIQNPERFPTNRRLSSYIGLAPKRSQSGETDKQLGITKAGSKLLRRSLVQSANYIMGPFGEDCDLRRFGEQVASRGGKIARQKAKVAVARKLALLLRRLWISDEAYDPDYKANSRKRGKLQDRK